MSELDQVAPGGVVQLQNSPASLDDSAWDSLFSTNPTPATPQAQPATQPVENGAAPASTTPAAPAQPAQPEYFLKGEESVYKTPEDAVKGVNHKDAQLRDLRTRYALVTGIDPLTGKPVQGGVQPQNQPQSYSQNPSQYLTDLYDAAKAGKPDAYVEVQRRLIQETLQPYAPQIQQLTKNQALDTLSKDNAEAAKFVGTPGYQKTLEVSPDLANAIAAAESVPEHAPRLPALYKLAHLAGQGLQLPELLKQNTAQIQTTTPTQGRPTATSTSLSPATTTTKPSFGTMAGIKATIADMEARGAKLDF